MPLLFIPLKDAVALFKSRLFPASSSSGRQSRTFLGFAVLVTINAIILLALDAHSVVVQKRAFSTLRNPVVNFSESLNGPAENTVFNSVIQSTTFSINTAQATTSSTTFSTTTAASSAEFISSILPSETTSSTSSGFDGFIDFGSSQESTTVTNIRSAETPRLGHSSQFDPDNDEDSEDSDSNSDEEGEEAFRELDRAALEQLGTLRYARISLHNNVNAFAKRYHHTPEAGLAKRAPSFTDCAVAFLPVQIRITRLTSMSMTFVLFQVWAWVVGIWGLLLESTPHLITAVAFHFCASIYNISELADLTKAEKLYNSLSEAYFECSQSRSLGGFFKENFGLAVSLVVIESIGTIFMSVLVCRLCNVFEWWNFKRLGADRNTRRANQLSLSFHVSLLVSCFFVTAWHAVWLHELSHNQTWFVAQGMTLGKLCNTPYRVFLAVICVLVFPWTVVGYLGFKRDSNWMMGAFFFGGFGLLVHTIFLLSQRFYRRVLANWTFLKFLGVMGTICIIASFALSLTALYYTIQDENDKFSVDWIDGFPAEPKHLGVNNHSKTDQSSLRTISITIDTDFDEKNEDIKDPFQDPEPISIPKNLHTRSKSSLERLNKPGPIFVDPTRVKKLSVIAVGDDDEPPAVETMNSRWSESTKGGGRWSQATSADTAMIKACSRASSKSSRSNSRKYDHGAGNHRSQSTRNTRLDSVLEKDATFIDVKLD